LSRALLTDTIRSIRRSLPRFLSILAIIALGVGFFAGVRASGTDMRLTADKYYVDFNAMDMQVLSTLGFSDTDVDLIRRLEGVTGVQGVKYVDCLGVGRENFMARVFSLPKDPTDNNADYINRLRILEGRLPTAPDECIADQNLRDMLGYSVGSTVQLTAAAESDDLADSLERTEFRIVGFVNSPAYIDMTLRGATPEGDGSLDAYLYIAGENFTAPFYTQLDITYGPSQIYTCYDENYLPSVEPLRTLLEQLETQRAQGRLEEMQEYLGDQLTEAEEKIADARQELTDGKQKLADARQELADGKEKLASGKKQLADNKALYEKSYQEYLDGQEQLEQSAPLLDLMDHQVTVIGDAYRSTSRALRLMEDMNASTLTGQAALQSSAASLRGPLNNMTDLEGNTYPLGELLYDENGRVTPQTVARTRAGLDSYYSTVQDQASDARREYENGREELADAAVQLAEFDRQLKQAEKDLAQAEKDLTEGQAEFDAQEADALAEIAEGEAELAKAEAKLPDLREMLAELEPAQWYIYDRGEAAPGFSAFGEDAQRIDNIAAVFPIFFLAVAALVCLTTMARMVEEHRTEIGVYKALGYSVRQIAAKFHLYSLSATVLGTVFGLLVGFQLFPAVIINAYCIIYDLPPVVSPFHWDVGLICGVVALLCVTLVTESVCRSVLRETPSSIMRPKAPPAGKRVPLEYIKPLWSRLSFSYKVTARNLFRYRKRVLMTLAGIAGSAALVLTGFGVNDAIQDVVDLQFQQVFHYDMVAGYAGDDPQQREDLAAYLHTSHDVADWMSQYRTTMNAVDGSQTHEINLVVSQHQDRLDDYISLQDRVTHEQVAAPESGVVITEKLGKILGIAAGDQMILQDGDGRRYTLDVVGVSENYAFHFVYLSAPYYEQIFQKAPEYNSVIMNLREGVSTHTMASRLLAEELVQMISSSEDMLEQFRTVIDNMGYVVGVLIVSAALLAFVVLYNLSNVNITERIREIASLKVLGFYDGEVTAYIYRENIVLTLMGTAIGLLLGTALTRFVVSTAEVNTVMFGRTIHFPSYVMAAILSCFFSFLVNFAMHFSLKRISMVESMKSVD